MQKNTDVYLLTGSNIEPRIFFLKKALEMASKDIGKVIKQSNIYESDPWGFHADLSFLNQVFIVRSKLSADEILECILKIEKKLGRKRTGYGVSSRTIDIDIIYYGSQVINKDRLTIPHPRLHERKFTLAPLVEIAADFNHPVLKKTNKDLLLSSTDRICASVYTEENGI